MKKILAVFTILLCVIGLSAVSVSAQGTAGTVLKDLNEESLKSNVAARVRMTRGAQDEAFAAFSAEDVRIVRKKPVQVGALAVYAVQVEIADSKDGGPPSLISLLVDASGEFQFSDIQSLADGRSVVREALEEVKRLDNLPTDFGKEVFKGEGTHTLIVVSDPFCPYCRRGWEYVMTHKAGLKTLRFAHFPLNAASEAAVWAVTDAQQRGLQPFEMLDFAYTRLNPSQNPQDIVMQYLQAYPELKTHWGEDAAQAMQYLRDTHQEAVQKERKQIQALGISSTPIFFVNGTMVEGFNAAKLDELLQ